ncbi:MAG: transcription antitermination factor NusB [Gammaproteobacteria bacterium]|nr:MAG: transcription antitermination factor NusB [Gammaproteobacteria bacterium]
MSAGPDKHDQRRQNHRRRRARRLALQALYQWQMTGESVPEILAQFRENEGFENADAAYFDELVRGVTGGLDEIDAALAPYLQRDMESVDPVERAVLRLAGYELLHRMDLPYRVVINEAIELAKKFGADQSHRFVNGVLDNAVKDLRKIEVQAAR